MSTPVETVILLNMRTALRTIARTAGYFNDVKSDSVSLDPQMLDAVPTTELPWINLGHRVEPVTDRVVTSRPNAIKIRKRWTLEIRIDAQALSKVETAIQLEADIERALYVDKQRGGVALFTFVGEATRYYGAANQKQIYLELPIEVEWQRNYGTP